MTFFFVYYEMQCSYLKKKKMFDLHLLCILFFFQNVVDNFKSAQRTHAMHLLNNNNNNNNNNKGL